MLFYGVVSDPSREAVELITGREEAEAIVRRGIEASPTRPVHCGSSWSS